jgi:threonine synthase
MQDILKSLFADPEANSALRIAAVNSINWARILAQITYYFHSYFSLCRQSGQLDPSVRFVVPTGNFGDILAGYFATQMGIPTEKLVVATNENDILHRFWQSGWYEKQPVHGKEAEGGIAADGAKAHSDGVKETLSPAMDILVSSNFERLLWFLAFETSKVEETNRRRMEAGEKVKGWLTSLKADGGFSVNREILDKAKTQFESERVSDEETIDTIRDVYSWTLPSSSGKTINAVSNGIHSSPTTGAQHNGHYILDPHTAIGVSAALRHTKDQSSNHQISLATAHPAKFSHAVELALKDAPDFSFDVVLPEQFVGMEELPKRVTTSKSDWKDVRDIVIKEVEEELKGKR